MNREKKENSDVRPLSRGRTNPVIYEKLISHKILKAPTRERVAAASMGLLLLIIRCLTPKRFFDHVA